MAFIPVEDTVQVSIQFEQDGVELANVFGVKFNAGYTVSDVQDLAEAVDQWVDTQYKPLMAQGVNYVRTVCTGLNSQNDFQASVSTNAGAGEGGAVPLPANVSKAITLRSGLTGRSARGRLYWVGLSTSTVELGTSTVPQSFIDDVIDALQALGTVLAGLGAILVIISRYTNNAPRAAGVTFQVQQFAVSDLTTDSMRGRLPR